MPLKFEDTLDMEEVQKRDEEGRADGTDADTESADWRLDPDTHRHSNEDRYWVEEAHRAVSRAVAAMTSAVCEEPEEKLQRARGH